MLVAKHLKSRKKSEAVDIQGKSDDLIDSVTNGLALFFRLKIAFCIALLSIPFFFYYPMIALTLLCIAACLIHGLSTALEFIFFIVFTCIFIIIFNSLIYAICFTIPMWLLYNFYTFLMATNVSTSGSDNAKISNPQEDNEQNT